MEVLEIILIITNLLFFIAFAAFIIMVLVDEKIKNKKASTQLKDLYTAIRTGHEELLSILRTKKIGYKGFVYEVEEVYAIDSGQTKLRIKDQLGFTKCVSITEITIDEFEDQHFEHKK